MPTVIGSGLGATIGFAAETTPGTYVTPTHFPFFRKESLKLKKNIAQSQALHGGLFELAGRRAAVTHAVAGAVEFDMQDRQFGLLFQAMLGGTPTSTIMSAGPAYQQITQPADLRGTSLAFQVGRPTNAGAMSPFNYNGVKVVDWEIAVSKNAIASLALTLDGWDEKSSVEGATYTSPSAVVSNILSFSGATVLLGGTATTTSGVVSVSGGTSVGIVTDISLKGENGLDVERYFAGASVKAEQLQNAFRKYTGSITVEFDNVTTLYETFRGDTSVALQVAFLSGVQIEAGDTSGLSIVIPAIKFEGDPPNVDGPQVLKITAPFTILDDGTNAPIQFTYVTLDTTP